MAGGPDIIDYAEWSNLYYELHKKIKNLKSPAYEDINIMFETTQKKWLNYSRTSLNARRHDERLYHEFKKQAAVVQKYITMAYLKGMYY